MSATRACEWSGCVGVATHSVTIEFPGEPKETWSACRQHDRMLKDQAVASRPKVAPPKEQPTTIEVCCGDCQQPVHERSDLPSDQWQPCARCGSLKRLVKVGVYETLTMHDSVRVRTRRPGKGGWLVDMRAGDDYTRVLEGWGRRELTIDHQQDRYRELIELHDGTRIESIARLKDHQD